METHYLTLLESAAFLDKRAARVFQDPQAPAFVHTWASTLQTFAGLAVATGVSDRLGSKTAALLALIACIASNNQDSHMSVGKFETPYLEESCASCSSAGHITVCIPRDSKTLVGKDPGWNNNT